MKKFIVANWKELPETLAQAEEILARADECLSSEVSLVICPPFKYIEEVARILQSGNLKQTAELGMQDLPTGRQVLPEQIDDIRYVIIGHSSRRVAGESDAVVNEKLRAALRDGLIPIVCVENPEQAAATFAGISADEIARCFIAYEPVWAISTNPNAHPDTPENAAQAIVLLREAIGQQRFLYGGSITPANAKDFLERPEFSGVLVGGASVRPDDFCRILSIAAQLR